MDYNNELKEIDTEQKAYFLGFMYADGCLTATPRKNSTYIKYQVQMSLIDENIINEFRSLFPFFNLNIFDFGKYKNTWSKQFALRKASRLLFDDLLNHGMLERKSGKNGKLLRLPNITKELIPHFIRGYFDGDGSISIPKKRPNARTVEICSSSKEFLLQIKQVLESFNLNCPIFREKYSNLSPLYVLEWVNSRDIIALKKFFYENSSIFLERKKEKFYSFRIIDKKGSNPHCPKCLERKTMKMGKRQMKHGLMLRFTCTNCNNKFSIPAPVKQDELLENLVIKQDNQQPSLGSNTFEGSTTNSRIQTDNAEDSNANTSVLPFNIQRTTLENGQVIDWIPIEGIDY